MTALPFAANELDELMVQAELDALLVTSKHNIRYLLGGHVNEFFGVMDALGVGRYLPVLVYVRGRPDLAHFVGAMVEHWYLEVRTEPLWVPSIRTDAHGGRDSARAAGEWLDRHDLGRSRIGIESAFLPVDAYELLREMHPGAVFTDALEPLESLRACKSAYELSRAEASSIAIVDAMMQTFLKHGPGNTKAEIERTLRSEQVARGLTYEYCLISMGQSMNRAPSDQRLEMGDVLCLDSGGQLDGYIGDVARMAVMGEPDDELESLLSDIDAVQQAARSAIAPGVCGREIFAAADGERRRRGMDKSIRFVAHGMGLISHEAPRLTDVGPVRYPATHADQPLKPGLLLSVESWIEHPHRGFIKLEDTVAVTTAGHIAYGDHGRGWNRIGRGL